MGPRIVSASRRWWPALLAGFAVACLVLVATRSGVDQPPDGTTYAGVARNIADGEGINSPFVAVIDPFSPRQAVDFEGRVPLLGWPPLYPLVMAGGAVAGMEVTQAARWVGALSAAVTTALVTGAVTTLTSRPRSGTSAGVWVVVGFAAAVLVVQPWFALVHVVVASEPLYLALSMLALVLGAKALAPQTPRRSGAASRRSEGWLAAAFLVAALCGGVRFTGVAVTAALGLGTLVYGPGPSWRRTRMAILGVVVGVVPLGWWTRFVERDAGAPIREVTWHPPGRADLELAVSEVTAWIVPRQDPTVLRVTTVLMVAGGVLLACAGWWRALRSPAPAPAVARSWLLLAAVSGAGHLAVLLATRSLADRVVPINGRLLFPVLVPVVVSVAAGLVWWWRLAAPQRLARVGPAVVGLVGALLVGGFVVANSEGWRVAMRADGVDPLRTPTSQTIRDLAAPLLAANDPALAWRITGAQVIVVPSVYDNASGKPNQQLDEHLEELVEVLEERDGVVVLYDDAAFFNPGLVGVEELTGDAGMVVLAELEGATVLAPG